MYNMQIKKTDPKSTNYYFIGYPDRSKCYRFYYPSRGTKIVECVNTKFFENDDFSGNAKVRDIVLEEERQNLIVLIVLKRLYDVSVGRNTVDLKLIMTPMITFLINPNNQIPFKKFPMDQKIR